MLQRESINPKFLSSSFAIKFCPFPSRNASLLPQNRSPLEPPFFLGRLFQIMTPSITIVGWSHRIQQWQLSVQDLQSRLLSYRSAQRITTVILQFVLSQMRISSSSPKTNQLPSLSLLIQEQKALQYRFAGLLSQPFCISGE